MNTHKPIVCPHCGERCPTRHTYVTHSMVHPMPADPDQFPRWRP